MTNNSPSSLSIFGLAAGILAVSIFGVDVLVPPGALGRGSLLGIAASIGAIVGGVVGVVLAVDHPDGAVRIHGAVLEAVERRWTDGSDDRGVAASTGLLALAMLSVVLFVVAAFVVPIATGDLQEDVDQAEAYCDQELGAGEYELAMVNAVWGGGLHCIGEDRTIHIHDVPEHELEAAAANASEGSGS